LLFGRRPVSLLDARAGVGVNSIARELRRVLATECVRLMRPKQPLLPVAAELPAHEIREVIPKEETIDLIERNRLKAWRPFGMVRSIYRFEMEALSLRENFVPVLNHKL
jgi:hypothetical protein